MSQQLLGSINSAYGCIYIEEVTIFQVLDLTTSTPTPHGSYLPRYRPSCTMILSRPLIDRLTLWLFTHATRMIRYTESMCCAFWRWTLKMCAPRLNKMCAHRRWIIKCRLLNLRVFNCATKATIFGRTLEL